MIAKPKKIKADVAIVESGLAPDIDHARALISCGLVFLGDKKITANSSVDQNELSASGFRIKNSKTYVSRGAIKLKTVFDEFDLNVNGFRCMDVGASTGGFTQVLIDKGAEIVFAVDVGKNILDYKLRVDPKVVVMEGVNARLMDDDKTVTSKVERESLDLAVFDLSFISLKLVVPKVLSFIKKEGLVIPLVKPQFEVSQDKVEKGGVVRDPKVIDDLIAEMRSFFEGLGLCVKDIVPSQLKGPSGNQEYFFVCLKRG